MLLNFRTLVSQFQQKLNAYQKSSSALNDITIVSIGGLIGGLVGTVAGDPNWGTGIDAGFGKLVAARIPTKVKEGIGSGLYRVTNPDRYKIILTLKQLQDMASI
jgi:hypothetical protein